METKLIAMIVVAALVVAMTATIYTQSAIGETGSHNNNGINPGTKASPPICSHPAVNAHNPHCS